MEQFCLLQRLRSRRDAFASQDTFLDAAHLESCFPGRRVTYTNVEGGAVPAPPFRVTFPELLPAAVAAAANARTADEGAPQTEGASSSLEPLQVEVRLVSLRCASALPGLARDDTLCSLCAQHCGKHTLVLKASEACPGLCEQSLPSWLVLCVAR